MTRIFAAALALLAVAAFTAPASADCTPGHSAQTDGKTTDNTTGT
jgi:Spy/CpxP family protein refolding chaperone